MAESSRLEGRLMLPAGLTYHLACLREHATDPAINTLDRLAVVRLRAAKIREIRRDLEGSRSTTAWRPT